jgi:phosphinothricin acetyltransferase
MKLVSCTHERHAAPILAIFNDAILTSTALFDYAPRPFATMTPWFQTKEQNGFPVIGVEAEDGTLLGFASYGIFRDRPAYKYTVEHSVYVHQDHRGKGLGRLLMHELIKEAKARGVHVLVGGIEASNQGSIALHQSLGFSHAGTINQCGYKFGRWLDVSFYQLLLATPERPAEG